MEADAEVSGEGNSYTTQFRQYDPRLGRWKSIDPLAGKYPGQSPYAAFNNNPVFFTDPLGLEGEPPGSGVDGGEEGGGDNGYQEVEGVTITAKAPSSTSRDQSIVNRALGRGEFGPGGDFEDDYGSDDWNSFMWRTFGGSQGFQNLQRLQSEMSSTQKVNIYEQYSYTGDGLMVHEQSDGQYRQKADENIMEGKSKSLERFGYLAAGLAIAGGGVVLLELAPAVLANPWAASLLKTGAVKGTINAGINGSLQYAAKGSWGDIDGVSVAGSFGMGFTHSSGLGLLKEAAVVGALDATFDINLDGNVRTFVDKNPGETISDFTFGTLGGMAGGAFRTPSAAANIWGEIVIGSGTTGMNEGIGSQFENK